MPRISIYKIMNERTQEFSQALNEQLEFSGEKEVSISEECSGDTWSSSKISLFFQHDESTSKVDWSWIFPLFKRKQITKQKSPKAVISIVTSQNTYALTFGHSFYLIDPFSDNEWPFEYARRVNYSSVKTTATTNPNSQRNKTVNTYIDTSELEVESGEAVAKLKAELELDDEFKLFRKNVEFGSAIKLTINDPTLETILEVIEHIEYTIENKDISVKIPVFSKVQDEQTIATLDDKLSKLSFDDIELIEFPEFEVFGTNIIFNSDENFRLHCNDVQGGLENLNGKNIASFLKSNDIESYYFTDIDISWRPNGVYNKNAKLRNMIYYVDDEENALLMKGVWYLFNNDYLSFLHDFLDDIFVSYDSSENYSNIQRRNFIEKYYNDNKDDYINLNTYDAKHKIGRRFYREYYYNHTKQKDNYKLYDREPIQIDGHTIEVADLYKDKTIFTVKIGNSSSSLAFAIDQSLIALRLYKNGDWNLSERLEGACLWLILDRKTMLGMKDNNSVDINTLKMLILKNKIVEWVKEVRSLGLKESIKINYVID